MENELRILVAGLNKLGLTKEAGKVMEIRVNPMDIAMALGLINPAAFGKEDWELEEESEHEEINEDADDIDDEALQKLLEELMPGLDEKSKKKD